MRSNGKEQYTSGDQIHFIITADFEKTANDFMKFCRMNSINSSSAIRAAISDWLDSKITRDKKISEIDNGNHFMRAFAEDYEKKVLLEE